MKYRDIQSKRKIYHMIDGKINNRCISGFFEKIIINMILFWYKLRLLFIRKSIIDIKDCNIEGYKVNTVTHSSEIITTGKDENYDLSILVPVYNVEKYLDECIQSILNQKTEYTYEIIFVNDGSTDTSMSILEKYKDNEHIKIYTQTNKGLAETRNVLLNYSTGKYVLFVDSDDVLEYGAVDKLLTEAIQNGCDIVQSSYCKFSDQKKVNFVFDEQIIENDTYLCMQLPGFTCGKVITKSLFSNKTFPAGYLYEDTLMPFLIYSQCRKVKVLSDCFYRYRINAGGIVNSSKNSICSCDTVFVFDEIIRQMKKNGIKIDEDIYKFLINCQFSYIMYGRIKNMDDDIKKKLFIKTCSYIEQINIDDSKINNILSRNIIKSFKTKNYKLWEYSSKILNICV